MATLKESNFNGRNGTHFKLKLDMTYEQDTTANKTTIRLWNNFVSMDGYSGSGSANSVTAYINSAKVGTTDSIGINQTKLLGYKDVVITHNQDGTFPNTAYSASIQTGWSLGEANVSGTMTSSDIPKINRQSTWRDFTIQDLESEFVLPINKYVSSYYNVVKIQNSNGTTIVKTIDDAVDGTAITFNSTELNSIYSMDNNASSYPLILYFELKTYTDSTKSTQVGTTQTKQVSGYLVNANPTYNVAYQDTNSTTLAITNNNQQIIQNNSTLQFNITNATALKGASLSSISIEINGVTQTQSISSSTLNFNYGTLNVANNINANVVLTDSRGLTTTKQVALTILSWELPNAIITLNRKSNYYTETDINVDANYSSLDNKNTITIQYRDKKKADSTWSSWNNLSDNVTTTFNADNEYEWDIQVKVQDSLGSTTYNLSLGIGIPIFFIDRRKRNAGVNCFPKETNAFEVNGNTEITGDLIVNNNYVLKKGRTSVEFDSTSNWTTSSTTAVDIPNASATLTTYGGDILIYVSMNVGVSNNMAFVEVFVDGTNKGMVFKMSSGSSRQQISGTLLITGLSSDSHTFDLKIRVQNSSNVGTIYSYNTQQMTIVEL